MAQFEAFLFHLIEHHSYVSIRFHSKSEHLFSEEQLKHAAPYRRLEDRRGFLWAWDRKKDQVKKVSFDFSKNFPEEGSIRVTMDL